ncbi:hypothetical protein C8F04DRAFT_1260863 [Mycena alexandri]|uniref:Uncharacterized protein n=1 Tax=Mycena alexandri TaxID=1745969 RepID=A0AAD6X659_9AGAR|nr:hypothetical protein C8F04DRAFT_1260863 [Mycena alexandri]
MAPFPLIKRIEIDRSSSEPQFLVNIRHGHHFLATRDRSRADGSIWSFKRCDADDIPIVSDVRYRLPRMNAHVFGQVKGITEMQETGFRITIGCPDDATCKVQELFYRQIQVLSDVLKDDVDVMTNGVVLRSWLPDEQSPPDDGRFYAWMPLKFANLMFGLDVNVELVIGLYRTQLEDPDTPTQSYVLTIHQFWWLRRQDVPKKGSSYACDTRRLIGCVRCT